MGGSKDPPTRFDSAEGSAQLSFGAAEIDEGEVRVGDQSSLIRAGSYCVKA